VIALLFWLSAFILAYTYVGYPVLIGALARWRGRLPERSGELPTVSIVIVAHNEGRKIRERLQNLVGLDYPRERVEILLASDGSDDDTIEQARAFESLGVRIFDFASRRGKPATLNQVVPEAKGEILLLGDARQRFDRRVILELVACFGDPQVGAVSGELQFVDGSESSSVEVGVGFYWSYEKFMRAAESAVDSTVGATGAIYALRRALYEPIPDDTLLDDVVVPMRIVRKGYRVLFERRAVAFDRIAASGAEEFTRKVRTIAGNFQLVARERWIFNPFRNRVWFQTVSHKVLRLASPLFLAVAFVAAALLAESAMYRGLLGVQSAFYAAALGGAWAARSGRRVPVLGFAYVFCLLNGATIVALWRFLRGSQTVTWQRLQDEAASSRTVV
jgi:biofilm PGA synthesis N-glycosyltransferase PgaC